LGAPDPASGRWQRQNEGTAKAEPKEENKVAMIEQGKVLSKRDLPKWQHKHTQTRKEGI